MSEEETGWYARGGFIEGDPVPMPIIETGYIITAAQLRGLGTKFLDQLNRCNEEEDVD